MIKLRIKQAFLVGICTGCLCFSFLYELIASVDDISIKKESLTSNFNKSDNHTIPNEGQTESANKVLSQPLPVHKSKKEDPTFIKLMDSIQTTRRLKLLETCKFLTNQTDAVTPDPTFLEQNVFYSKAYNLAVCHIKKCGFSSWIRSMLVMDGFYPDLKSLQNAVQNGTANLMHLSWKLLLDHKYPIESQTNWKKSLKVVLVRHPYARLVSAYYDKMVPRLGSSDFYTKVSKTIYEQYRHVRNNLTERNRSDHETSSFEDFLNYLVSEKQYDGHWQLFDKICHPCKYEYDYIAKFETLSDDMRYLKEKLKISARHRKDLFPRRHFNSDEAKTKKEFEKIPRTLKNKLYRKYRNDFELFGYERL